MDATGFERLTEGQKECLRLFHARFEVKDIARRIGRSPVTVHQRLAAARKHLGVDRSVEAARMLAEYEAIAESPANGSSSNAAVADAETSTLLSDRHVEGLSTAVDAMNVGADLPSPAPADSRSMYSSPIYRPAMLGVAPTDPAKVIPERPSFHSLLLPFPTRDRPVNDMSFGAKLTYVVVLAALIALVFGGMVAALTGLSELF